MSKSRTMLFALCTLAYSTSIDTLDSLSYAEIDSDSLIRSWKDHEWSEGRPSSTATSNAGTE